MLAVVEEIEGGYIAKFNRPFKHSVEKVWATLTENDKLEKWMHNLEVVDLRNNGTIKFNFNDGSGGTFDIKILDYKQYSHLQFEWGKGWVRFELTPKEDGCLLVLKEFIPTVTDHTAKDLAGWQVCLDLFKAVLEGRDKEFPMDEWEKYHETYTSLVKLLI